MARKAFVSSDMAHDEKLIDVSAESAEAALLWPWIITYFDDWGRAEANAKRIKAQLFPMNDAVTPELIETALNLYAAHNLVILYEVRGKRYVAIPPVKWWKYQTHIHKSKRKADNSRYPSPEYSDDRGDARSSAEERGFGTQNVPYSLPPFHPSPSPSAKAGHARAREGDATPNEPSGNPAPSEELPASQPADDFGRVTEAYHEQIGMFGPSEFEHLRAWHEDNRVSVDVMVEAIEQTGERNRDPTLGPLNKPINYLNAKLRGWANEGVTTLDEAKRRRAPPGQRGHDPDKMQQARAAIAAVYED